MNKTLIIAEAGVNHNGSIDIAKRLVDAGAEAGVDVVKFQTFNPASLTSQFADMAEYQKKNIGKSSSQLEMLKKLTLSKEDHYALVDYCDQKKVKFCSSPFDLESIDFLHKLKVPFWKIPSGEITNLPYLRKIASFHEPVIMSSGMSTLGDIENALESLLASGLDRKKITLLHCNTEYPTPPSDVNLNVMKTLQRAFNVAVGFSDHTMGLEFPIAAVALGATVIEKHITLDKSMSGPDHRASLEPDELKNMVYAIRNIELGMGSFIKKPTESEIKNLYIARKSIVASRTILEGEILSSNNLTTKRPGNGMTPMLWDKVIGKKANKNYQVDECIDIF